MLRVIVLISVSLLVVGCGRGAATSPASSAASPSSGSDQPPPGSSAGSDIGATLPTQLGGMSFAPPQALTDEFLAPLANELGVDPSQVTGAMTTTGGQSAGPEIAVVRIPGVATDKLVDAFLAFNAKALDIPATVKPTKERLGGKNVAAMRTTVPGGGPFLLVVYGRGDTAYMVASEPALVEEALSKLP